jgi:hypothetical protein
MARFLTPLQVEEVSPDIWRLLAPLIYESELVLLVTVPAGFLTDLESIPRWIPFAYALAKGQAKCPAVVHDRLYEMPGYSKTVADDVFYEAMTAIGVPWAMRWPMWAAVHLFGTPNFLRLKARARLRATLG